MARRICRGWFFSDITDKVNEWGRANEWYPTNWEGGKYENKTYGIWSWTDVRACGIGKIFSKKQGLIQRI